MSEQKEYWMTTHDQGSIKISEDVVASIAAVATSETDGVSGLYSSFTNDIVSFLGKKTPTKGVKVTFHSDNTVDIDICYLACFGSNICDVAKNVQENVKSAVESMTNLDIGNINIHVAGVTFNKEISKEANIESQEINSDEIKIDELIEEN
ncbi:MAG TPA: Asp23/Gls24 family envelope stress response protein [Candidatus Butyricicoccus avistercoris]|uniref:Asp23/Gls24 family envelope stress response protein n=1 Tax=Candidatus Butyricicoccus avistercoris TaxID=2838518 RepID=A0A9D1PGN4_9FIRM|nr:Asp23/Gls24 family envelope stress response protein [Candidatus Butyricicoccus avistercoris]